MKRLTKTQQYAILYMLDSDKSETEIIKSLKISQEALTKFIEKNKPKKKDATIKTVTSTTKAKDLMITKTSVKNNNGVAIMTKESSEVADDFKKKFDRPTRNMDSIIHKPNG